MFKHIPNSPSNHGAVNCLFLFLTAGMAGPEMRLQLWAKSANIGA